MISQQAKIMIFVTKAGTLRAKIIPASDEPLFEITLGGNEWMAGKGSKHHPAILEKAAALVDKLQKQLAEIVRNLEQRKSDTAPALQGEVTKMEKAIQPSQERRLHDRSCDQIPHAIRIRSA